MIKDLFTKRDHRSIPGITKDQAIQAASWYWRSRQFGVTFTSELSLRCEQFYSKLGLKQSVDVWVRDEGQNTGIDLTFSASLTDEGAVVGVVGAVLLLPVTVAVGAVSYMEYENDAQRLMNDFWSYIYSFSKSPGPPADNPTPPAWAAGQPAQSAAQPQPARTCASCGTHLDPDAKFCKMCGSKVE